VVQQLPRLGFAVYHTPYGATRALESIFGLYVRAGGVAPLRLMEFLAALGHHEPQLLAPRGDYAETSKHAPASAQKRMKTPHAFSTTCAAPGGIFEGVSALQTRVSWTGRPVCATSTTESS
jgi:hypothetical protein